MPFAEVVANIAIAKKLDFRAENMVIFKPSAAKISIYKDAAKTLPVACIPIGVTTLEIKKNPLLYGEFYIESSIDTQTVTINWW